MNKQEILDKLNAIAVPATSWLEDAKYRVANRKSLQYSQEISLRILRELRKQQKTQAELAEVLGVSAQLVNKWVKGKENFTLDTIAKIEEALGIDLLEIQSEIYVTSNWFKSTYVERFTLSESLKQGSFKSSTDICKIIKMKNTFLEKAI